MIVDYDLGWPADFATIQSHVGQGMPPGVVVEHIGSTSVPGLAAKPIIDVDIVVRSVADVPETVAALVHLGYEREGDLAVPGREAFSAPTGLPYHHLYVVVAGSKPHRDHVDLRDYLRDNPNEVERYASEKRRLAHLLTQDREQYVNGKGRLVEEFLSSARA
jgi:GrpB-like predicted nucleotidyltransferase (UPF0157 family)